MLNTDSRLLISIIVSPLADFSGKEGPAKKTSLENRIGKLNATELNLLNKELDKISHVKNANEVFSEKETGVLLLNDQASNKQSIWSKLSFSTSAIIEKITDSRKHLMNYIGVESFKNELPKELIFKSIEKSETILLNEIELLNAETTSLEEKNKNLNEFVEKIKNDKKSCNTSEFIASLLHLFDNNENIPFASEKTEKIINILAESLTTTSPIENVALQISSKIISSKMQEHAAIINKNNEQINEITTLQLRYEEYKSTNLAAESSSESTMVSDISKALETIHVFLLPSKTQQDLSLNLDFAIEITRKGFADKYQDKKCFENYNKAIQLLREFVTNQDLNNTLCPLSDYLHLNLDSLSESGKEHQKQLLILENVLKDSVENNDSKMEYSKKFICYLKEILLCTNDLSLPITTFIIDTSNLNLIEEEIGEPNIPEEIVEPTSNLYPTFNSLYSFNVESLELPTYTRMPFTLETRNNIPLNNEEISISEEDESWELTEEMAIDQLVRSKAENQTSFEDRRSLITTLLNNGKNDIHFEFLKDEDWRLLANHPLVNIIYQNFYFIMKEKEMIKNGDMNWGGLVFMKEGHWQELVQHIDTFDFNHLRNQALQLTIDGITRTE